jgi:hypothetical protein
MNFVQLLSKLRVLLVLLIPILPSAAFAQHYVQTNLVSSISGVGTNTTNPLDSQLINAWGLARSATSFWWVSDNGPITEPGYPRCTTVPARNKD